MNQTCLCTGLNGNEYCRKHRDAIKVELVFECKDDLIAKYCDREFRKDFTAKLIELLPDWDAWTRYVNAMMDREAFIQEWYDYRTDDQGNRHVILNPDGTKKLLAPTVRIEPV